MMRNLVLLVVCLFVAVQAFNVPQQHQKVGLSAAEAESLCSEIEHPRHALFSAMKCVRPEDNLGQAGRDFKAKYNPTADDLDPIILMPGIGGSGLDAQVHKDHKPAWNCFKNLDWFQIWFNVGELLAQKCWFDNLNIDYVNGSFVNTQGVEIRPHDFGGVKGVAYLDYILGLGVASIYSDFIKSFEEVGYKAGLNIRGAPYDWRMPATSSAAWFADLQALIEETYTINGNRSVHIIGHSMGGPTSLYFLNLMTQEWRDTYIKSYIPIAAPWSGAASALLAVITGDNFGVSILGIDILNKKHMRDVARQAGGLLQLIPNLELNSESAIFVTTDTKNYTVADFPQLFSDIGSLPTVGAYEETKNTLMNLQPPRVANTYCLYGYGHATPIHYTYPTGDWSHEPHVDTSDLGDGTVPLDSLQECNMWQHDQTQPVVVQEFNLKGHSDIIHDDEVIQFVLKIATNQQ